MAKADRLRVVVDDSYVSALGRAAYVFAVLEWNAVWCCERMEANYIRRLARKTAGQIAKDLVRLAKRRPPGDREEFLGAALELEQLVTLRNGIFHGKPGTAPDGAQRLFHAGRAWSVELLEDAADQFAQCSTRLNALLYGPLKER